MGMLPYQKKWMNDPAPVKVWEKSRRIGASFCDACDSALVAAKARDEGGMSTYYLSYNKDMTKQYVRDVAFWAKKFNIVASDVEEVVLRDEDKDITIYQIRFASGFEVQGLSSNPSNLRSKQGRVRIDEAAFVEDLAGLLKAALALIMWGGDVALMSTHNGEDSEFNLLMQDIRAGKFNYSLHLTNFDDALDQGLYKAICKAKDLDWSIQTQEEWRQNTIDFYGDGADEELFCIPSKSKGSWLNRNLIESCMTSEIPVIRWSPPAASFVDWPLEQAHRDVRDWLKYNLLIFLEQLPNNERLSLGGDFGRSGDLTVYWPLIRLKNLSLQTPFVLELQNAPFRTQEQIQSFILNNLPRLGGVALDARGNGQALAEYARQDFGPDIVHEIMLSVAWYRENMPRVKAFFEDRTWSIPKNDEILDDFRGLQIIKGVPRPSEARTKTAGGQRHCDSAVAGALALYANTIEGEPVWETPVTAGNYESSNMLRGY